MLPIAAGVNWFTVRPGPVRDLVCVEAESALAELRQHERRFTLPALEEAIRLLCSESFRELTGEQIRAVGDYRSIEIGDEVFFERAFSPGKAAAASLAFARHLGRRPVLEDLLRLRATLGA
jgi:hypothetical protein